MTGPLTLEARLRTVKIIHAALMAGVILFLLVTVVLRRRGAAVVAGQFGPVVTYVGLGVLAGALVLVRILPRPDAGARSGRRPVVDGQPVSPHRVVGGDGRRMPRQRDVVVHHPSAGVSGGGGACARGALRAEAGSLLGIAGAVIGRPSAGGVVRAQNDSTARAPVPDPAPPPWPGVRSRA